jgi:hypothetical protein
MRPAPGCCGITVTGIELSREGVVTALGGVWRASFGPAAAHAGDVVLELLEPDRCPLRSAPRPAGTQPASPLVAEQASEQVAIRLLVAAQDRASEETSARREGARGRASRASSALRSARKSSGVSGATWLWLGGWPCVGPRWPYLVGPLVFIAWEQEHRTAPRAQRRP